MSLHLPYDLTHEFSHPVSNHFEPEPNRIEPRDPYRSLRTCPEMLPEFIEHEIGDVLFSSSVLFSSFVFYVHALLPI